MQTYLVGGAVRDRLPGLPVRERDWVVVKHDGVFQGDTSRWDYLRFQIAGRDLARDDHYAKLADYLDLGRFADYLVLCWYIGLRDWPGNNWYGIYRDVPPGPMSFFVWDAEQSWNSNQASAGWVHPEFRADAEMKTTAELAKLWHAVRRNADFMMLFADRVHHHGFGDGALVDSASIERWQILAEEIEDAVLAECFPE